MKSLRFYVITFIAFANSVHAAMECELKRGQSR
jgi:hypothetical protein